MKSTLLQIGGSTAVLETVSNDPTAKNLIIGIVSTIVIKLLSKAWTAIFNRKKQPVDVANADLAI
ncbi:hypothetical protein D3C78_1685260 [compost metagenome]